MAARVICDRHVPWHIGRCGECGREAKRYRNRILELAAKTAEVTSGDEDEGLAIAAAIRALKAATKPEGTP